MSYKIAALDLKDVLDYTKDKDWYNEILNDPQGRLISRDVPWIDLTGPNARRTSELAQIFQNVRDRTRFPKNFAPGRLESIKYYTAPIKGIAFVSPDKKELNVGATGRNPSILAHQIGHTAQKNTATTSRYVQGFASVPASWMTKIIKNIRAKYDKDYDPSKFDTADKATAAGAGIVSGLASWIAGTKVIKSELNASGRGLRYLRNATYADLPQSLKIKGIDYSKLNDPRFHSLFGPKVLNEAKPALRKALKSYKKTRLISALLHTITPVAASGLDALFSRGQKKKVQLNAAKE